MTQAVKTALRERLERVRQVDPAEQKRRVDALLEFGRRWRESPVVDPRPLDEILAYDENGLPV